MNISRVVLPMALLSFLICIHSVSSVTRPIRDFIDYNAREDGDQIISLPSNGPAPSFVLPPPRGSSKKAQVQRVIPSRGSETDMRSRAEAGISPTERRRYATYSG